MQHIKSYRKLRVYQAAIDAAMRIFELTKKFSVRTTLSESFQKSVKRFCGEAEETRVWADLALRCGYLSKSEAHEIDLTYDRIFGQLVRMTDRLDQWTITKRKV